MAYDETQSDNPRAGVVTEPFDSTEMAALRLAVGGEEAEQLLHQHQEAVGGEKKAYLAHEAAQLATAMSFVREPDVAMELAQSYLKKVNYQLGLSINVDDINLIRILIEESRRASQIEVALTLKSRLDTVVGQLDAVKDALEAYPEAQKAVTRLLNVPVEARAPFPVTDLIEQIQQEEDARVAEMAAQAAAEAEAANPPTLGRAFLALGDRALSTIKNRFPRRPEEIPN